MASWQEEQYGKVYKSQKTKNAAEKAKNTKEKRKEATYNAVFTQQAQNYAKNHGLQYNDRLKNALNVAMTNKKRESEYNTLNQKHQEKWNEKTSKTGNTSKYTYHQADEFAQKSYTSMRKEMGYSKKSGPVSQAEYDRQSADYQARKLDGTMKFLQDLKKVSNPKKQQENKKEDKETFPQKHPIIHNILTFGLDQKSTKADYKNKLKEKPKDSKNIYKNYLNGQLLNVPSLLEEKLTGKKPTYLKDDVARKMGEESSATQDKINLAMGSGAILKSGVKSVAKNLISKKGIKTALATGSIGAGSGILQNKYQEQIGNKMSGKEQAENIAINSSIGALLGKATAGHIKTPELTPATKKLILPEHLQQKVTKQLNKKDLIIPKSVTVNEKPLLDRTVELSQQERISPNQAREKILNSEPKTMNIEPQPQLNPTTAPLSKVVETKPLPINFDSVKHISEQISHNVKPEPTKPIIQRLKDFTDRVYYNMVTDKHGIARLDKAVKKNVDDHDSAVALAERAAGSGEKSRQELENGIYDSQGQKIGASFKEVLQFAKDPDKLQEYLVAKGVLDYDSKGMTAIRADGYSQRDISDHATARMEADNPNIVHEAKAVYQYIDHQQQILKEGGMLNDDQIAQMKKENPNYIGMQRLQDEGIENFVPGKESLNKRLANVGKPINKRTGSEKPIIAPFETIVKRQYVYNNMAERNKVGRVVLNHLRTLDEDNIFGNIVGMEENASYKLMQKADEVANDAEHEIPNSVNEMFSAKDGKNNLIYVYEDGHKYTIQVKDKLLFDSMMAMDTKSLPVWMKAVNLPVRMLRAGVTLSPDFGLRNVIRDQLTTAAASKHNYIPFVDAMFGAVELLKGGKGNSNLLNAYTRNGGDMSVLQNIDRTNIIQTYQDLKGNKPLLEKLKEVAKDPVKLLYPLQKIGEFSERATRLGHMRRATKNGFKPGVSIEQATHDARSTMDFNRAGAWGRQYNQVSAFFNASIQGLDVIARAMKNRPVSTMTKIGAYVVAPTVALYKLNEDQQWFKDLPVDERDKNWFFKVPHSEEIVKIPKPFEVGILFGAGIERALDKGDGAYDGYVKELYDTITPDLIPTIMKPILEVATNYNMYTHQNIESQGDKFLPTKDRKNAYNSQFAGKISEILSKINRKNEISPKDVDHLVRGYTGTLGSYANEGIDMIANKVNPTIPDKPSRGVQTMPFIRSFIQKNLEGNNKPISDFYQLHDDLQKMSKEKGFSYGAERQYVNQEFYKMNKLQGEKRDILDSNKFDGKTKSEKLKDLNKRITEMARQVNGRVKINR